jgi:endonuclease/exonuclease/phosphatase family metal-dependent hydrolase
MQFWPFYKHALTTQQPLVSAMSSRPASRLRVLSFNVRYATSKPFTNEKPWTERFPLVMNQLQHETRYLDGSPTATTHSDTSNDPATAIICLQEVLHNQLIDILGALNELPPSKDAKEKPSTGPLWAHVGVGRDDGGTKGEYSPVIYPINVFNLLYSETVWLSPTPEKPSKGWDAGSIRVLTVAVLEYKSSKHRILASATHLDNAGSKSRENSVKIILCTLKRVHKQWCNDSTMPAVLAGDFNSFTDQEAYLGMAQSDFMYDLYNYVPPTRRYGEEITFTGFEPEKDKDEQGRIDFIWIGPKDSVCDDDTDGALKGLWKVDGYSVVPNVFDDGVYASDHRCVVGDGRILY